MFGSALNISTIYFLAILLLILVLFVVVVFLIYFIFLEFSPDKKIHDAQSVKENAYRKAFSIIEEARGRSLKILQDSNAKAQKTLKDASFFNESSQILLNQQLKDMSDKQVSSLDVVSKQLLETYKKSVETEESKNIETLANVSKDLKDELLHEVDEFKEILHRETIESQQMVDQKVAAEFKKVEDEINAYKSRQLKKIDDTVYKILAVVSKDIFGRVLSLEDHQDLVLKSLEKAKDQSIFQE